MENKNLKKVAKDLARGLPGDIGLIIGGILIGIGWTCSQPGNEFKLGKHIRVKNSKTRK